MWDEQTDVIVIGSGVAGCSAAIEARAAGASVIVFEKMKVTGGNTRISDGGLAAPNNYLQAQQGIEDSPELFYQDLMTAGLYLNHPSLAWTVAEQAADAVKWLQKDLGLQFMDRLDRFGGHSVARALTTRSHSGVAETTPGENSTGVKRCSVRIEASVVASKGCFPQSISYQRKPSE